MGFKKILSAVLCATMVAAPFAGVASAEGKTITYWSMWESTEPQGQALQEAIDAYQEATGNTVDVQFKGCLLYTSRSFFSGNKILDKNEKNR